MKTNTFITLSTATANIGVLVGLVFLIFELRQNSAIALSQIRQERSLSVIQEYSNYAQDKEFNELKTRAIMDGDFDSVNKYEWNQIRDLELVRHARLEDVFFQYKQGLIDDSAYEFGLAISASRLPLWEWLNIAAPNPEFAAAIEDYTKREDYKQSLLAAEFKDWSKDKERPNRGLGSPFVFK